MARWQGGSVASWVAGARRQPLNLATLAWQQMWQSVLITHCAPASTGSPAPRLLCSSEIKVFRFNNKVANPERWQASTQIFESVTQV